jgi:hypothetical protein
MGATPDEVASTFAVMAPAMIVEACGGTAEATAVAARPLDPQDHGPLGPGS